MIAICVICGREFVAKRSTAKYCSCRCKHIAHRGTGTASTAPPIVRAAMTDGEVWELVCRAHELAADLSRASMLTHAPVCRSLARVSRRLADSLGREGL